MTTTQERKAYQMEHPPKALKLSSLWTCRRSIEASCSQRTEAVLDFVDALFEDMRDEADNAQKFTWIDGDERASFKDASIKDRRLAVDGIRTSMHMKSMQLEIFRRAVQHKQDEIKALAVEESKIIAWERHCPTPSPNLPNEILAKIFSHLYWSESKFRPMLAYTDLLVVDNRTTLQKLLDDGDTTDEWKNLINQQIPCIVTTFGISEIWMAFEPHFGPHPRVLPVRDLHEDLEGALERPTTTIVVNLSEKLKMMEDLESIRHKPWRNVFIAQFGDESSSTAPMEAIKGIVQNFGDKLAGLDRLTFYELSSNTYDTTLLARALVEANESEGQASKLELSYASLPSHLLPAFHPILSNISHLETTILMAHDPDVGALGIGHCFQLLVLCSNTLSSVAIVNHHNSILAPGRTRARMRLREISFPRLNKLSLSSFTEDIVLEILSAMHCPSLRHFTLSTFPALSICSSQLRTNSESDGRNSAKFIHNLFPNLEYISVGFGEFDQDAQFLSDLANPDESGNWIFPLLDSMSFEPSYATLHQLPLLKALTKMVINRMRSTGAKNISYLSLPEFKGAESADCDALRLFVPGVRFVAGMDFR
ncbi:hypothetical protein SCHPADRAFT_938680 [Schizopora paradoxa]|uniref:Uncharacterized protein n=1 Tax=Schizopora paradoxa TaxID=27342 RepID=A0A0H2SEI6_9AGAM|nr:hypothetical protein SCHPADRAFT_938680 [Schizopora paradoxa]